ncbi:hypothetical protein [Paracoccus sp. 22332]|uniref:hypothetical protein n=1 Tax=Paracoccus sp. 22332 TaxID=3453913 RepID=UPI003F864B1E
MRHALILTCVAALAACTGEADTYPSLLPTDRILAEPALPDHAPHAASSVAVDAEAQARADALRQRADALRGPVIEPDALSRMRPQD